MVFKSIIGAVCACLAAVSFNVNAIPMVDYNGGGEITGVSRLEVDGMLYDMTLHNSSFDAVYVGSGAASVYTENFANLASRALVDFSNAHPDIPGHMVSGCELLDYCGIVTVYYYPDRHVYQGYADQIVYDGADIFTTWADTGGYNSPGSTFATWAVSASVPEPSIAILMASGLIAFGVVRRKSRV